MHQLTTGLCAEGWTRRVEPAAQASPPAQAPRSGPGPGPPLLPHRGFSWPLTCKTALELTLSNPHMRTASHWTTSSRRPREERVSCLHASVPSPLAPHQACRAPDPVAAKEPACSSSATQLYPQVCLQTAMRGGPLAVAEFLEPAPGTAQLSVPIQT